MAEIEERFADVDETDSVDIPVKLIEDIREGLQMDDDCGEPDTLCMMRARDLLRWVDSH